jgi:hypothetical protein
LVVVDLVGGVVGQAVDAVAIDVAIGPTVLTTQNGSPEELESLWREPPDVSRSQQLAWVN